MSKKEIKEETDKEIKETWLDVIKRNCDTVPGFKELIKLSIYILCFLIFVLIMAITFRSNQGKQATTTTTTIQSVSYQDILAKLLNNSNYKANIKINDNTYIVDCSYGNSILTGTFESIDGTYKFKVKDNTVYELRLDEEIVNEELFKEVNYNLLNNNYLINILKNNSGIKVVEESTTYKYDNITIKDISYNIDVTVINDNVSNITIYNDNITYQIDYI